MAKERYKTLPAANPADERWILGMAMLSERAAARLFTTCTEDWFANHECKAVFNAVKEVFTENLPFNGDTFRLVAERVKVHLHGYADNHNALAVNYHSDGYGVTQIHTYIDQLLKPHYEHRKKIIFGAEVPELEIPEIIDRAQRLVEPAVTQSGSILDRHERHELLGIKTGMPEVDDRLGLWRNGHFILLGADSSMGKSAFAGDLCRKLAMTGVNIGFASLEMDRGEMMERWLSGHANHLHSIEIPYMTFSTGGTKIRDNMELLKQVQADLDRLPIHFVYSSQFTINQIRAEFIRVHTQQPEAQWLFVIDYVQLIQNQERGRGTRQEEVALISAACKTMAKQLNAPILVLSQLNKSKDFRDEGKPTENSFRESNALFHDADKAIALYAKDRKEPARELIILKNRSGMVGSLSITYDAKHGRFWTPQENIVPFREQNVPDPKALDGNMPEGVDWEKEEIPF